MTERGTETPGAGPELQEVTNGMVGLYKDLFGRGPTKARTDYAGRDTLVVTIQDSLTQPERSMVELGERHRVREVRLFFQHATAQDFKAIVERSTGRKVWAYASGMDTERDVAVEVFYLESEQPANGGGAG
jgi:uncharacterized protein YbcI